MRIAFLGTGLMGAPMARRLAATHEVAVWNRSSERANALSDVAEVFGSPVEAVAGAEVVIFMLVDGPTTRQVFTQVYEAPSPGTIMINMGSVDPQTDRELALDAAELNLKYLDAPVSGGVVGAEAGTLSIFVGGTSSDFQEATAVLGILGRPHLLGPVGVGQIAKLANQIIVATTIGAVSEAFQLARSSGCDISALRRALSGGFAESRILEIHGARMIERNFKPGGRSATQLKDLDNAMTVADELRIDLPLSRATTDAFRDFVEKHEGGELDHSAYYLWLERRSIEPVLGK